MRRRLLAGAGLAGAALAGLDARDRRRISADPLDARLREAPAVQTRTVAGAGGTPLHVELHGPADAPPVVLIHGWTCSARFWRLQVQDLAADHRVIAYDLRGHGRTGAPADGDWSLDTFGADLEAVLDATVDAPAVLAGHSLGAMTIAAWAGDHDVARRARAVALVNTGLGDLITESLLLRSPRAFDAVRDRIGALALGAGVPLPPRPDPVTHRAIRAIALSKYASPAAVRYSERMVLSCSPRVRAACGRELSALDLLGNVRALTVPATVLYGSHDILTPKAHALRLAEALPDCEAAVELPESGHMGPLERPDHVSAAIRALCVPGGARPAAVA